jgi:serine/threonine protein kinase
VEIGISDFGEANFTTNTIPHVPATAAYYSSPKILLHEVIEIGKPVDIWAMGCTIFNILGDRCISNSLNRYYQTGIIWDIFWALGEESLPRVWKDVIPTDEHGNRVIPSKPTH